MSGPVAETSESEEIMAEVVRLREQIARLEERVRNLDLLAHQDPLLGLPNRRGFMRELQLLISRVKSDGDRGAMLFIDIDGLKGINDGFGHKAGDEALAHAAALLAQGVRKADCVARIGGDEFAILLPGADDISARETAARLMARFDESEFVCDGNLLPLGAAIGVAVIADSDDAESVMSRADREMYREKAAA